MLMHKMFMANSHDKNSPPGRVLAKNQRQQNSFIIVAHSQILMETFCHEY